MLALCPYLPATTTHGALASRLDTLTLDTSPPSALFHHLARSLNSAFSSYSVWGPWGARHNAGIMLLLLDVTVT
jgi:hypothetical protein